MSKTHGLRVSPAGSDSSIDPDTGERDGLGPFGCQPHAAAFLPHSCDEWVIGYGTTAEVIARLRELRAEVDVAIAYLEQQPEGAS